MFPLERQILAAARPIARSLLDIPLPSQAVFADIQRLSQEPDRDERDPPRPRALDDPAGDEPGQDGDRRGDAHVHLPEPVRLPDRRGRRQPGVPRRTSATTSRAGGASRRSTWSSCSSAFSPVPVLCAPYFDQEVVGAGMLDRLADALFGRRTIPARCSTTRSRRSCGRRRRGAPAPRAAVRPQGRHLAEEDRARADRRRRRPAADDHAPAGAGRLPAHRGDVRGGCAWR